MTAQARLDIQELRQQVELLLAAQEFVALENLLDSQHPADIADVLELLDDDKRITVFARLPLAAAAEVLDETRTETTRDLVEAMDDEQIADLLDALPVDDATEVLTELSSDQAATLLALMEPADAAEVETLLAYPENSAGRLMATRIARLRAAWTVEQALEYLRHIDREVETIAYLYVVDDQRRLVGVVPLRELITHPPQARVSDFMVGNVISVRADVDQEQVARIVAQYDFFAVPVVDADHHLLGIVTHDDVIDILEDEFTEDVQRFGGSVPLAGNYLATPILTVTRKRVGWLLVLFLTEMLTGSVMRLFESELEQAVALAFFVPLLIGTGGNSGSQTTSTIIRALAVGEARFDDLARLLWHELRVGILLGVVMGVVGYLRALTWGTSAQLALTVSGSLLAIVIWANLIGALLPPLASRLKIDPAVISGPVMSTLVDATGLLIYFTLARVIIGL